MKSRVLIVDDKPENLRILGELLGASYEMIPARSGEEALELLQKADADVILMDIEMPGLDGFETTRRIKEMPGREEIPVILISGLIAEDPSVKKGRKLGAADCLSKPFDLKTLRSKVAFYSSFREKDALIRAQAERIKSLEGALRERSAEPA